MSDDLTPQAAIRAFAFSADQAAPAPAAPVPPAPTSTVPTVTPSPVAPHSHADLSESQHAAMVGWAREDAASGKLSPEAATKLFDQLGVPADQRTLPTDLRSEEQRLIDEQFSVGRAQDFLIAYADPGRPAPPMTKAQAEFDQSARGWLVGAEFPTNLGNSLVTTIAKVAQQTKAMSPGQLESYGLVEYDKLIRAYGGEDKLQEKLHAAAVMIQELDTKRPGLKNLLRSRGIGDNALVVAQIIGQSERWHARRKGR